MKPDKIIPQMSATEFRARISSGIKKKKATDDLLKARQQLQKVWDGVSINLDSSINPLRVVYGDKYMMFDSDDKKYEILIKEVKK